MRKMNNNYASNTVIMVIVKNIYEQLFYDNIVNWGSYEGKSEGNTGDIKKA